MKAYCLLIALTLGLAIAPATYAQRSFGTAADAPTGRVDTPLTVAGAKITIRNVRNLPGNRAQQPPKGYHFLAFDLTLQNTTAGKILRMGAFFEGLSDPTSVRPAPRSGGKSTGRTTESLTGPGGLTLLADPAQSLGTQEPGEKMLDPGASFTWTVVKTVRNDLRRAVWKGMLITNAQQPTQRQNDYKIDLGTLPAYTPPADITVPLGTRGTLLGYYVKIVSATAERPATNPLLEAFRGNTKPSEGEEALAGLFSGTGGTKPGVANGGTSNEPKVAVRLKVEIGNPLTEKLEVNSLNAVVLEDNSGGAYQVDLLASAQSLLGGEVPPNKQTTGELVFIVPQSKLGQLKARFNPATGSGNVVVPLTGLRAP
jgi:hypothetical protein